MSHIRDEEVSREWSRPGLVSCDLNSSSFQLQSRWGEWWNHLRWLPRSSHSLPLIAHRAMNPTCSPAGDYRQITALQLHRIRNWAVMTTAPFPGRSSAVPWGFAHAFAMSLADPCPWWSHHDFSSLVQFLSSSRKWTWGLRESGTTKGFWKVHVNPQHKCFLPFTVMY